MSQPALILFAKRPVAGEAKTRLQPRLSAERAAEVAAFLIRASVELAVSAWPGPVLLYTAPDTEHPLFRALSEEFGVALHPQADGDLGARMHAALQEQIERHGAAAVMGCDVPHSGWEIVDQANHALARGRNVLGPTEDGGYYFIGLQRARAELFADIPWGGHRVLETTLARAGNLGLEFDLLPRLRDIDTADDLWFAAQKFEALKRFV